MCGVLVVPLSFTLPMAVKSVPFGLRSMVKLLLLVSLDVCQVKTLVLFVDLPLKVVNSTGVVEELPRTAMTYKALIFKSYVVIPNCVLRYHARVV